MTPLEMLLSAVGAKDDPNSGGRQMPSHWGHKALNIVSQSSPTGTQCLQAVGCAEAGPAVRAASRPSPIATIGSTPTRSPTCRSATARPAKASSGSRSTPPACASCRSSIMVEDNGYAISVPVEVQTPAATSRSWWRRSRTCWSRASTAPTSSASYARRAAKPSPTRARAQGSGVRARQGHPPVLALAVGRRAAVQDAGGARGRSEARSDRADGGVPEVRGARQRGRARGDRQGRRARGQRRRRRAPMAAEKPGRRDRRRCYVYSPDVDPTSTDVRDARPQPEGKPDTMVAAINRTLKDEMARNPRIVVFGEDVADCSREAALEYVPGKGGVFKVTHGLQRAFGGDRVFNSPLAEANIIGRAIGMATRGIKPVVEIQFFDYIWPAMMQMRDEMSMLRYRSNNAFSCPMVIRVADRRLPARRRAVSQPVGREHLRALPGHPHRVPVERAGRGGPAAHGDPLRRSGAVPRAQAPVPADLQQGRVSRPRLHDPVRQGRGAPRRHRRRGDHLGRAGAALAARGAAGREGRHQRRWSSTCARSCPTTGRRHRRGGRARPTAWSSRTRIS